MPKVTYLLVQEETPLAYKIHDIETSKDIPNTSDIQVLLDQAAVAVRDLIDVDPNQRITLKVYKLLHPIADFRGQALGEIKRELGELDQDFLDNKAVKYSANDEFSLLQVEEDRQGKVLILFKVRPETRSTLERVRRETEEVVAWYEKDPRHWFRPEYINKLERVKEGLLY